MSWPWWLRTATALLGRPRLWWTALHEMRVTIAPNWWTTWPPIPRPPAGWMRFRMETAYGAANARPDPEDLLAWLEWCRTNRSAAAPRGPRR